MRRRTVLSIAIALPISLAGCATFRGMGEDLQNLGKGIKGQASK